MKKIFVSVCGLLISVGAMAANQQDINVMRNYYQNYDNCVYERGIKYCDKLFADDGPDYDPQDYQVTSNRNLYYGYNKPQNKTYSRQQYRGQSTSDVNGFIGGSVGYAMADYDDDILDGLPDGFFGFSVNAGLSFLGKQQTYNPGVSIFYDHFFESDGDEISVFDGYSNLRAGLAASGHAFGGLFDNYINIDDGNAAFFFGIGYSQINVEVTGKVSGYGAEAKVSADEDYNSFVAHIGVVLDVAEHIGLTISDKLYLPESDSGISFINVFMLGARLTF